MKKIALGIALAMLLTMVFGVFASAVDAGKAVATLELFGLTEENGDVTYTGTTTEGYPDDEFGVAVRLTTGQVKFCYYKFTINWDPNLFQFFEAYDVSEGDILGIRNDENVLGGSPLINTNNADKGEITFNRTSPTNFQKGSGRNKTDVYDAICCYIYFIPLSDAAANAKITFSYAEVNSAELVKPDTTGETLSFTLNGGAAERTEPLESLGAQIHETEKAIRFGADFYNIDAKGDPLDLGMFVVSSYRLGAGTLSADLDNNYVAKVHAYNILNFQQGLALKDYDKVTFVAAIFGLDGHLDADIVARPYVQYSTGYEYSDAMVRNYNQVAAEADGNF